MEKKNAKTDFAGRSVHSQSQTWCTPPKYVDAVRKMFGGIISLDPCSNKDSIVNAQTEYILPENDGLKESWNYPSIYVNPPYGADYERGTTIKDWIGKCETAYTTYNSEVLALIPVATNTTHWKKYIFGKATGICFLYDTRLKFLVNGSTDNKGAPMACAIIYWGNNYDKFCEIFSQFGATIDGKCINFREKHKQLTMEF
jgi:hypothetical protein